MVKTRGAGVEAMLAIRVRPGARQNAMSGWSGDTVKLQVAAPPVEGAANVLCLAILSKLLNIPRSHLTLVKGVRSRNKVVRILGLSREQVCARLDHPSSQRDA
jgi:uncharacterized protein (TIGR00251 family)